MHPLHSLKCRHGAHCHTVDCRFEHPNPLCHEPTRCMNSWCNKRHAQPCVNHQFCNNLPYCEFWHHEKDIAKYWECYYLEVSKIDAFSKPSTVPYSYGTPFIPVDHIIETSKMECDDDAYTLYNCHVSGINTNGGSEVHEYKEATISGIIHK